MRPDLENRTAGNLRARPPSVEAPQTVNDLVSLRRPSNGGNCLIKDIDINKSEDSKLAMEPQQMKREKKRSYNLRKSLAWDRAFFTEEGVLDPLELSIISGASLGGLPFIREDSPGSSTLPLKGNLVKEPEDEDLGKDRMNGRASPMLNLSSSSFVASTALTPHKVSTHFGSKANSSCGDCPQPVSPTSLKRPANVNAGKAAGKESKLSKVPDSGNPGLDSVAAKKHTTLLRANYVRHNQSTQPDFNTRGNAGTKNIPIRAKLQPKASSRQSASSSNGQYGNSLLKSHSSANVRPILDVKADSAIPKMIPSEMPPARFIHSSGCADTSTFPVPFSHNAQGRYKVMHPLLHATMKPSGLRMPSPSLSFFSQPKVQPKAQLKASVPNRLTPRDVDPEIRCPEMRGLLRLQENCKRTLNKTKNPGCEISSSEATNSASGCMGSHVTDVEFYKPNLEESSVKRQDLSKGNIAERLSDQESGPQEIYVQVPSQNGSPKHVVDVNFFKKAVYNFSVKNGPVESGLTTDSEMNLEQNFTIPTSETLSEINKLDSGKKRCNSLILNHRNISGPECERDVDCRVRSSLKTTADCENSCNSSLHESESEEADPSKYSRDEINKSTYGDNLETKERAIAQLGTSQKNGRGCSGNASLQALKEVQAKAENSDFGSRHCLKEADSVLTDNIPAEEVHNQNCVGASTFVVSQSVTNLTSEINDDTKQSGAVLRVENIFLEAHAGVNYNVEPPVDWMSSEKQICLQYFQEERNVGKLLTVIENDENQVNNYKIVWSQSPGKVQDCSLDGYSILEPHINAEFISTESFSPRERHGSLIKMISNTDAIHNHKASFDDSIDKRMFSVADVGGGAQDDKAVSRNKLEGSQITGRNIEKLFSGLHQENHRINLNGGNSSPESRNKEVSQTMDLGSYTHDGSENSFWTSTLPTDFDRDSNSLRNARNSMAVIVQSREINVSSECSYAQSGPLASPTAKSSATELCKDNELQGMEDSVAGESELFFSILKNPHVESPLNHESCNDINGSCGQLPIGYATIDPSTVEAFPDSSAVERSEDTKSSSSCPHPQLNYVDVEAAFAPNNKQGSTLMERSQSLVVSPNAIPFSDEWLAAIEAAGEDILTKKSGAVQNSPPDKSLPEPSPWSPVKKKNNQIGPYDCTKFTNINILPDGSSS